MIEIRLNGNHTLFSAKKGLFTSHARPSILQLGSLEREEKKKTPRASLPMKGAPPVPSNPSLERDALFGHSARG